MARCAANCVMMTLGALAALGLAAALQPASSQTGCSDYARLALQQARENEQRKCGFTGPEWSTDLKGHATWCATVGPSQWKAALQKRAQMLSSQCKK
ncbi:MAG: hypothetical protein R3D27_03970 [Hyphomicrobiaceae bacterium]